MLNSSQLDLVRSSGFCDFLIVEKLGCGISRGRYENVKYLYAHCCGSGSGIQLGIKTGSGSGMINPDHVSDSLETNFLGLKYLNYLMGIRDGKTSYPGSGMENIRIRDKHPGSATLLIQKVPAVFRIHKEFFRVDRIREFLILDYRSGSYLDIFVAIQEIRYAVK